jgi:hypothetical protein
MTPPTSHLPALTSDYPLRQAQVSQFQLDGHLLLRGVAANSEVAAYRPVILEAREEHGADKHGYLGDLPISDESEARFERFIQERGYTKLPGAAMAAGDATFHYGWTLHGAPGNASARTREVMTIIWFADGTRVGPLDNANRQRDRDRWLPGLNPGDLAATELNPLVFKR